MRSFTRAAPEHKTYPRLLTVIPASRLFPGELYDNDLLTVLMSLEVTPLLLVLGRELSSRIARGLEVEASLPYDVLYGCRSCARPRARLESVEVDGAVVGRARRWPGGCTSLMKTRRRY